MYFLARLISFSQSDARDACTGMMALTGQTTVHFVRVQMQRKVQAMSDVLMQAIGSSKSGSGLFVTELLHIIASYSVDFIGAVSSIAGKRLKTDRVPCMCWCWTGNEISSGEYLMLAGAFVQRLQIATGESSRKCV